MNKRDDKMTKMNRTGMKNSFPKVFKGKHDNLTIVYKNRIEEYKLQKSYSKSEIDKTNPECSYDYEEYYGKGWNAHHEVEVLENNGFKRVRDSEK